MLALVGHHDPQRDVDEELRAGQCAGDDRQQSYGPGAEPEPAGEPGAYATDDATLKVTIGVNYAPTLVYALLGSVVGSVVDMKTAMAHETAGDMGNGWLKTNSAGSGAYIIKSWTPNQSVLLEANPNYRGGAAKLKRGGSSGGHNGLKDITAALGTQDYWRLRLGIGHPRTLNLQQAVADFVLHRPRREEQTLIEDAIDKSLRIIPMVCEGKMSAATMQLHTD